MMLVIVYEQIQKLPQRTRPPGDEELVSEEEVLSAALTGDLYPRRRGKLPPLPLRPSSSDSRSGFWVRCPVLAPPTVPPLSSTRMVVPPLCVVPCVAGPLRTDPIASVGARSPSRPSTLYSNASILDIFPSRPSTSSRRVPICPTVREQATGESTCLLSLPELCSLPQSSELVASWSSSALPGPPTR